MLNTTYVIIGCASIPLQTFNRYYTNYMLYIHSFPDICPLLQKLHSAIYSIPEIRLLLQKLHAIQSIPF